MRPMYEQAAKEALRLWSSAGAPESEATRLAQAVVSYGELLSRIPTQNWNGTMTESSIGMDPFAYFVANGGLVMCGLAGGRVCNLALVREAMMWTIIECGSDGRLAPHKAAAVLAFFWPASDDRAKWEPATESIRKAGAAQIHAAGNGRATGEPMAALTPAYASV